MPRREDVGQLDPAATPQPEPDQGGQEQGQLGAQAAGVGGLPLLFLPWLSDALGVRVGDRRLVWIELGVNEAVAIEVERGTSVEVDMPWIRILNPLIVVDAVLALRTLGAPAGVLAAGVVGVVDPSVSVIVQAITAMIRVRYDP
jgi:hypothetical protein